MQNSGTFDAMGVAENLTFRMLDAFPNLDAALIIKTINDEKRLLMPMEDADLLMDLVVLKLTAFQRCDSLSYRSSNIVMAKTGTK